MGTPSETRDALGPRPERVHAVDLLKTGVFLAFCFVLTAAGFYLATFKSLQRSTVDRALAEMTQLLDELSDTLSSRPATLPVRLLTAPSRTPELPAGVLPRDWSHFHGEPRTRGPIADPWEHSYLLVAKRDNDLLHLTCLSSGPNGRFETAVDDDNAQNDDVRLHIETLAPTR